MMKRSSTWFGGVLLEGILLAAAGFSLCSLGWAQNQAPTPARARADETLEMCNFIENKLVAMAQESPL
jgi:hypothetical protein